MNSKVIINVVFVGAALILALFLGQWVVTAPKEVGIGFALIVALIAFFVLNKNVWILVPTFMTVSISFPWIPGSFSPIELTCMYLIACTAVLLVARRITFQIRMTAIEWSSLFVILMLAQSYARNPAGLNMFQSDYVGGRPYLLVIIALFVGIILSTIRTTPELINKAFKLSVLGYIGSFGINVMAQISGKLATYTGLLFGVYGPGGRGLVDPSGAVLPDPESAGRNSAAATMAKGASRILIAFRHPLKALYSPFWLMVLMAALVGAGMSGFRNVIASTVLTIVLGTYYWGRSRAIVLGVFIGISGYVALNIMNLVYPLPPNIQRSLTFLPGTWEERYRVDAESSTDWRLDMWKEALYTERFIENKLLGDGLGIRKEDFTRMVEISFSAVISDEMSQERAMLAGDFHSGPVTTIRVIGYVGLFVLIGMLIVVAIRAHKMIMYARGKPFFMPVIYFCLPMVWFPIFFLFVFGSFKSSIPTFFIQMGLLRLLENNLKNQVTTVEPEELS